MTLESIKKNKALKIERIGLKDKTEIWIDNKDNGAQKMRKNKDEEGLWWKKTKTVHIIYDNGK